MGQGIKNLANKIIAVIAKKDIYIAGVIAIVVIATGSFFGYYNNKVVPTYPVPHFHYTAEPNNRLSYLSNWDGPDYLDIVQNGYQGLFQANFFPLYPMTIYAVHQVVPSALDSALLISWVCFAIAIYFYIKIIRHLYKPKKTAELMKAIPFFVLFPTAMFFIASYTEGLFAALALGSIYFALKKRYVYSGVLLALCTATHITGGFVVALVVLILLENHEKIWKAILMGIVGSLGLLSYMYYLQVRFHDPFAFIKSQEQIHGWLQNGYSNLLTTIDLFNAIFIILIIISIIYWWKRRKSFAVYSFLFLLIPLLGRQFGGFNRYVLMVFPVQFMLYAYFKDKNSIYPYITAILGISWTYFLLQYAGGYIGG